jgi:SAM-dependent methyltransferase
MKLDSEFSPPLSHPYYFVRHGLKDGIAAYAGQLKGRMMDFGCGSKPYRSFFEVSEYIGVDFENVGHPHDNEQIDVFYDGKHIPFENGRFDSILCSEVFEHIFNLEEIIQELSRVLKTEGHMLITCPFVWNEHEVPHDFARYTRFALESMLSKQGFEIISFTKAGNFITAITQLTTLYFFNIFKGPARKFFLFRWLFKFFFFFVPNLTGAVLSRILPENKSLYLNNVLLVKKVRSDE